jgi:hypothetical protein
MLPSNLRPKMERCAHFKAPSPFFSSFSRVSSLTPFPQRHLRTRKKIMNGLA